MITSREPLRCYDLPLSKYWHNRTFRLQQYGLYTERLMKPNVEISNIAAVEMPRLRRDILGFEQLSRLVSDSVWWRRHGRRRKDFVTYNIDNHRSAALQAQMTLSSTSWRHDASR